LLRQAAGDATLILILPNALSIYTGAQFQDFNLRSWKDILLDKSRTFIAFHSTNSCSFFRFQIQKHEHYICLVKKQMLRHRIHDVTYLCIPFIAYWLYKHFEKKIII